MKKLISLTVFVVLTGCSTMGGAQKSAPKTIDIISTGYGVTSEESLQNAKVAAAEQVTGAFIISKKETYDSMPPKSTISQHAGGLITNYSVLSVQQSGGLVETSIKATVDTNKINTVFETNGETPTEVGKQMKQARTRHNENGKIMDALDDRAQAYVVHPDSIKVKYKLNYNNKTSADIDFKVVWQPKWYDDVRVASTMIGTQVPTDNSLSEALKGVSVLAQLANPAVSLAISAYGQSKEIKPKYSDIYMICFGKSNNQDVSACYETDAALPNIESTPTRFGYKSAINVRISFWHEADLLKEVVTVVNPAGTMYSTITPDSKVRFSTKTRKFYNPGLWLFQNGAAPGHHYVDLDSEVAEQITRVTVEVISEEELTPQKPSSNISSDRKAHANAKRHAR